MKKYDGEFPKKYYSQSDNSSPLLACQTSTTAFGMGVMQSFAYTVPVINKKSEDAGF